MPAQICGDARETMQHTLPCPFFRKAFGWCVPIGGLARLTGLGWRSTRPRKADPAHHHRYEHQIDRRGHTRVATRRSSARRVRGSCPLVVAALDILFQRYEQADAGVLLTDKHRNGVRDDRPPAVWL